MAASTFVPIHHGTSSTRLVKWVLTDAAPTGEWVVLPVGRDRSVHVVFSAGTGTVTFQGSNEADTPANPVTLRDVTLADLSFTASGLHQVLEITHQVRPVLIGGSGATVTVWLLTTGE